MSVPECRDLLTPLYALLETITMHYNQVLQLRDKLELLTMQTVDRQGDTMVDTVKLLWTYFYRAVKRIREREIYDWKEREGKVKAVLRL